MVEKQPFAQGIREQKGDLRAIEDKIDFVLELLGKMADGMVEGEVLASDDVHDWKQRCRARSAARRERRKA